MPPSVRRLEFRPRARADLADIFQYSVDFFGIDRARAYITALDDVLIKLIAGQVNVTKTGTRGTWRVKSARTISIFGEERTQSSSFGSYIRPWMPSAI